ncbi:MAG: DNA polymerase III subunit gamma/tau [Patescibacteria group bacterium]|jgi:DNA polymerase-3 subunit gamma/tau
MSLYRKYRSQKFSDLIGEDHVRDTLLSAVLENRVGHGYLFAGPRGIGKTSAARLLAKAVNCQKREELIKSGSGEPCCECQSCKEIASGKSLDVIEIDAASNRGIDEIRELRDRVKFSPTSGKYKVFIIDEVHMLTLPAFNALLKTLEEPPKHAIFILATTEAHKIPATILSRVARFDFRRIRKDDIIKNLKKIIEAEKLNAEDAALDAIAVIADGSHRDSISLLEQIASVSKEITLKDVENILGMAKFEEVVDLLSLIAEGEKLQALMAIEKFTDQGTEAVQIIREIVEVSRQLLLLKISDGEAIFDQTQEKAEKLRILAAKFEAKKVASLLNLFIEAGQLVKDSPVKTLPIEMAIIESCGSDNRNEKLEMRNEAEEIKDEKPEIKNLKSKTPITSEILNPDIQPESGEKKSHISSPISQSLDSETWKKILDKIKEHNHTLNALMRDASPEGISGTEFIIAVKFKFHHDKISEIANKQIVEKVIEDILGKKYIVKCTIKDKSKVESRKSKVLEGPDNDLEKAAKEMFEVE